MANSLTRSNDSLLHNFIFNLKNSSFNKPIVSIENLKDTSEFTLVNLNNLNYYISNKWLDSQITSVNFEKLSEFNPKLRKYFLERVSQKVLKKDEKMFKESSTEIKDVENENKFQATSALKQPNSNLEPRTNSTTSEKQLTKSNIEITTTSSSTLLERPIDTETTSTKSNEPLATPLQPVNINNVKENTEPNSKPSKTTTEMNENLNKDVEIATISIESIQSELNSLLSKTLDLSLQTVGGASTSSLPTTTITTSNTNSNGQPSAATMPNIAKIQAIAKEDNLTSLNNRIKILEFNMSLSSQYLEKLSQHYR